MLIHAADRLSSVEIVRAETPGAPSVSVRVSSHGFAGDNGTVYLLGMREFIDDLHHAVTTQAGGARLAGTEEFLLTLNPFGRGGAMLCSAQVGKDHFVEGPGGGRAAPHRVQAVFLIAPERARRLEREFQTLYEALASWAP